MKGQIERRAMELGGWPVRTDIEHNTSPCHTVECDVTGCDTPPSSLSKIRLIATMRKIDPDLADMIESMAPVYLVKKER